MKQKILFVLFAFILMVTSNIVFYFIAKSSGFGNNYSFFDYLYLPIWGLLFLSILLLFLRIGWGYFLFIIINTVIILFLTLDYSIESYDLLEIAYLEPSRFCYVIINAIRKIMTNETILLNVVVYTVVFSVYYYLIFSAASLLVKKIKIV